MSPDILLSSTFAQVAVVTASIVVILTFLLTIFAEKVNLMDIPTERKRHNDMVPLVGGLAIYIVIIGSTIVLNFPEKINWIIFSTSVLVAVGVFDDAVGLSVGLRIVAQVTASILVIFGARLWVSSLGLEFWGIDNLPSWLGISFSVFAIVGLTNAFNMIDGIDGLAAGQALIAIASISVTLLLTEGSVYNSDWLLVLASSVFAFFLINLSATPLKRVFLGDAGALMLGFIVALVLIYYTQNPVDLMHPVAALWCVTLPVFDTLVVIARRIKNRRSVFAPDRDHLHHLLTEIWRDQRLALLLILVASVGLNGCGIWITYVVSPLAGIVCFLIFLSMFAYVMLQPGIERSLGLKLDSRDDVITD